jgi:ATP-dependent Clp protease ATP-binding subunit ClpA
MTERARRIVFFAQEEAARLGCSEVGVTHLLLALCREDRTEADEALQLSGIDRGVLREAVEAVAERADGPVSGGGMTLTLEAKRALDQAYEFSRMERDGHIGTEHLLIGVACQEPARTILQGLCEPCVPFALAVRVRRMRNEATEAVTEDRRVKATAAEVLAAVEKRLPVIAREVVEELMLVPCGAPKAGDAIAPMVAREDGDEDGPTECNA